MTKTSILVRSVLVVLAAMAWSGAPSAAHAQEGSAASAGSQSFNPFASFSLNRFAFNTLGFLQVGDASPFSGSAAAGGSSSDEVAAAVVVRPPYRPPVRSPYRPPPRPPF